MRFCYKLRSRFGKSLCNRKQHKCADWWLDYNTLYAIQKWFNEAKVLLHAKNWHFFLIHLKKKMKRLRLPDWKTPATRSSIAAEELARREKKRFWGGKVFFQRQVRTKKKSFIFPLKIKTTVTFRFRKSLRQKERERERVKGLRILDRARGLYKHSQLFGIYRAHANIQSQ